MADIQKILMYFLWTKLLSKLFSYFTKLPDQYYAQPFAKWSIRIALKKVMDPKMCISITFDPLNSAFHYNIYIIFIFVKMYVCSYSRSPMNFIFSEWLSESEQLWYNLISRVFLINPPNYVFYTVVNNTQLLPTSKAVCSSL